MTTAEKINDYYIKYQFKVSAPNWHIGRIALYTEKPNYFYNTYFPDKKTGDFLVTVQVPLSRMEYTGNYHYAIAINFWNGEGTEMDQTINHYFEVKIDRSKPIFGPFWIKDPNTFNII